MNKELNIFIANNKNFNWKPTLPIPKDLWNSTWPWAPFFLHNVDIELLVAEMKLLDPYFVTHREKDKIGSYGHEGWCALTLHGIAYDKTENYDIYGFDTQKEANYDWTEICHLIPKTMELMKRFPFINYGRVRIMRLDPGGYIMPHKDGEGRIFGPFNFALTNPEECEFVIENFGTVPFKAGRGFMLDLGLRHCVINRSNEYRYHLIIHGEPLGNIFKYFQRSIKQL